MNTDQKPETGYKSFPQLYKARLARRGYLCMEEALEAGSLVKQVPGTRNIWSWYGISGGREKIKIMMTKMYTVSGMMCEGCLSKVKTAIKSINEVIEAQVQSKEPQAIISMREDISDEKLREIVHGAGHYSIRSYEGLEPGAKPQKRGKPRFEKVLGIFQHKKDCCQ